MDRVKIKDFQIYQYTIELNQPLLIRQQKLTNRSGLIIRLISEKGTEGFGEAAPLPGYSRETLSESSKQLHLLKSKLMGQTLPDQLTNFNGQFEHWLNPFDLSPSARFGFESAVLNLLANARHTPIYKLIPETTSHPVRVSGLLAGSKDQISEQTKKLINQGFSELKLKVGNDVDDDIEKVLLVNNAAYGKARLHLDANQMWNFDQAVSFGKAIGCAAVSYIEEPFKDCSKIPEFFDQTLIPVALDESIQHLTLEKIRAISGVEILVLKPTILGGIEKTLHIMTQAKNAALDTIISSSFESSVGIWTLVNIVETTSHNTTAGLDTLKWFKDDVLKQPVSIQNGMINIDKRIIGCTLNIHKL